MTHEKVSIELSNDEALVLYGWIARFNQQPENEFADQAEQRVLWDIEAILDSKLTAPLASDYEAQLASARDRVRDSVD